MRNASAPPVAPLIFPCSFYCVFYTATNQLKMPGICNICPAAFHFIIVTASKFQPLNTRHLMLKLLERPGIRKSPQTCVTQNIKTKDERRISALNPIFTKAKGALMLPHTVSISKKFSKLCIRILHF